MSNDNNERREWLEPDGLGGFASGTVSGVRTRRYHALLLFATPSGRLVLVNGLEAWVKTPVGRFALSAQRYSPDVTYPDGASRIESFTSNPWPTWTFRLEDGTRIEQSIVVPRGEPLANVQWKLLAGDASATLEVRPLVSGRDYHATHHENPAFQFRATASGARVTWQPYDGVPAVTAISSGVYLHSPQWYRHFQYDAERERGLDFLEDLASPGVFQFALTQTVDATLMLTTAYNADNIDAMSNEGVRAHACRVRRRERVRRSGFATPLDRAADAYIVAGARGKTIIAGYPWFTDWGRDTFIAMRGLCLATGRLDDACDMLLGWADSVSEGMLPNRFPDHGQAPEYNAVDASLWYIIAAHEFLEAMRAAGRPVAARDQTALQQAIDDILTGYARGTRFGIQADDDGLLACGVPGVQLTWMDAKVGDWVVTPRVGKPVEVQALWLNALAIGSQFEPLWRALFEQGRASLALKFWNNAGGYLYDVVDADHVPGRTDAAFRPNQLFAIGGLPLQLIDGARARSVVDEVEARLWTPLGPRSLDPQYPDYKPHYEGDPWHRDGAYHQGTVWPWLAGPFVEAWVRVRGGTAQAKAAAREKFVAPLLAQHLPAAGIGHISEIADGDAPHAPRGCPWQAWSVGEMLRLQRLVLGSQRSTAADEAFDIPAAMSGCGGGF